MLSAPPPEWAQESEAEIYALRRFFGITAEEAEHGMPLWERELLLEQLVAHESSDESEADMPEDPFARPPER